MSDIDDRINQTRSEHPKVWGSEDWIVNDEEFGFCGKRLLLNEGYQCSIHSHARKSEVFYINKGLVLMQAYGGEKLMLPSKSLLIKRNTGHRFIGITDAEIIEFSSFHRESDSHRVEPSGEVPRDVFQAYLDKYSAEIAKHIRGDSKSDSAPRHCH